MQVGTTKDQDLYKRPSAAVHPGALVARTVPQYNTIQLGMVIRPVPCIQKTQVSISGKYCDSLCCRTYSQFLESTQGATCWVVSDGTPEVKPAVP